jgi:hypothetical protein
MDDINRRDTLKLASAAAALGAGLGALFNTREASAQPRPIAPGGAAPGATPILVSSYQPLKIDAAAQIKIDAFKQIKFEKGFAQVKMYSGTGQFLHAMNVPEEIVKLFGDGSALQWKFFNSRMEGAELRGAPDAFASTTVVQIKMNR